MPFPANSEVDVKDLLSFPAPPEAKMGASSQHMRDEAVEGVAFSCTFGPRSSGGSQNLTPHGAVSESPPTTASPAER